MATKYINSITYGGNEYKFVDDSSGYTKDVKVDNASVVTSGVANLVTSSSHPYNASTNALATMADIGAAGGGTVTSVGLSNATNGGLTISGSPITSSGSITVGHTNVLTSAQNTQGVYPITIDKNGHVASYGAKEDLLKVFEFASADGTVNQMGSLIGITYSDSTNIAKIAELNSAYDTNKVALKFISTETGLNHTVLAIGSGERITIDASAAQAGTLTDVMMFPFAGNYLNDPQLASYIFGDDKGIFVGCFYVSTTANSIMIQLFPMPVGHLMTNYDVFGGDYSQNGNTMIVPVADTDNNMLTLYHKLSGVSATSTQAVYPITFDEGGHITSAGNAVTISDTKVTNTLVNTTKYYMTGTTTNTTNTGTQIFDSGIYSTTTAGQLNATTYKVNEQVTLQWNSTDSSLDFVFN